MEILNALIDFLNTEAGTALILAIAGWIAKQVSNESREHVDRAARIAVFAVAQAKKHRGLSNEEAKEMAVKSAVRAMPILYRVVTRKASIEDAIESVVGQMNHEDGALRVDRVVVPEPTEGAQ